MTSKGEPSELPDDALKQILQRADDNQQIATSAWYATASRLAEDVARLVAEVRRLRGRLHHHHVAEGLPDQDDTEARAIQELQDAMDKFHLVVENAEQPARLRELLARRCRICSEFDGTLPKRDRH